MRLNTELVVKDNALNQYTFYKSSVQLKIFTQLIIEIRKDPKKVTYSLEIKDILKKFWGSEKNYFQLRNICKKMMQIVDIPKEKWFSLETLFYRINTEENWLIGFEVNPNLKPYLVNITNNFTSYHLEYIVKLTSGYSIRIYELLKQYQDKIGWWWWKITIDKLRELLKIDDNIYPRYPNFKQKIILVAQRELEEKTDIKFQFEEQKKGRKIDVITFYILPNKKANSSKKEPTKIVPKELPKITKNESYKILSEKLKIDEKFIEEIYKTYDEKRILENAKHTLKEFQKGSIKSSLGGFLRESLKHNFANQKSLLSLQEEQKEIKKREELKKQKLQEEKKKREEEVKQDFQKNITQKVEKYISENG